MLIRTQVKFLESGDQLGNTFIASATQVGNSTLIVLGNGERYSMSGDHALTVKRTFPTIRDIAVSDALQIIEELTSLINPTNTIPSDGDYMRAQLENVLATLNETE